MALEGAVAYLLECQLPSGAINDPVDDPLAALARPTRRLAFRLANGADIWHTVNALLALQAVAQVNEAAARFVRGKLTRQGALSYWSAHPSLCIETCAATAHALPGLRARLARTIERHALPGGRWPNFLLPGVGGYDAYATGPSVTAWALSILGQGHRLAPSGRAYLRETMSDQGLWRSHGAFYATPYYPAHLAVACMADRQRVVRAVLRRQRDDGGWGFGDDGSAPASALPTGFAMLTLAAGGAASDAVRRALERARRWLLGRQDPRGGFAIAPVPRALFYAGNVYATCVAIRALVRADEVLS
jgi:hypothetical protein